MAYDKVKMECEYIEPSKEYDKKRGNTSLRGPYPKARDEYKWEMD